MNTTLHSQLRRLRDRLPPPLSRTSSAAWRVMRDWRLYRDGLLFDWLDHEYHTEGMTFEIPRDQTQVPHRARFHTDTHERPERTLARRFIPRDACVLELGACFGVVSAVINRCLDEPTWHVAVEPSPNVLPVLQRNRDRNGCRFIIEQALVSARSDGEFFLDDCPTMSSAHKKSVRRVRVPVVTVDELERKHDLRFDTLMLDIQGGEHEFLHDNEALLRRCRCIVLEQHPHIIGPQKRDECRDVLDRSGLHLAERDGLVEAWTRFPIHREATGNPFEDRLWSTPA